VKPRNFSADFPAHHVHNVPYDGQCAFSAISHQLRLKKYVSDCISGDTVRGDVVNFLSTNNDLKARVSERLTEQTIDEYITDMSHIETWADENIMYAASLFYDVEIRVLRSDDSLTIIGSSSTDRSILLGYVRCGEDESPTHYISLVPNTGYSFIHLHKLHCRLCCLLTQAGTLFLKL